MARRELGLLLVGLVAGLVLAVVAVIEFVLSFHHKFIVGMSWRPGSVLLAVPFLLILFGLILLRRRKDSQTKLRHRLLGVISGLGWLARDLAVQFAMSTRPATSPSLELLFGFLHFSTKWRHPKMTAISATTIGSWPRAGTHREVQGTNNTRGICAPTIQAIVSQNHKYFLSSHRRFIASKIVMADSQAARPVPDFPTELNRKKSGDVRAATAMDQSQVVSCFFLSAFSSSGFS
jgi:hypothetical protein